jgi:hypothetical protein
MNVQNDIQLKVSQYEITDEKLPNSEIDDLPEWLRKELFSMRSKLMEKEDIQTCIQKLEHWCKEFPDSKVLSNFLCTAYKQSGSRKFASFVKKNYKRFPDYLFARIEYADYCIRHNQIEKIHEIFNEGLDLKLLYPEREVFHVSEFLAFHSMLCAYLFELKEYDMLLEVFETMHDVAPNHLITRQVRKIYLEKMEIKKKTVLEDVLTQVLRPKTKNQFFA